MRRGGLSDRYGGFRTSRHQPRAFIHSVALQECINPGIAESPVHLGAVEAVAVHGKDNTLNLVCLPLVLEADFHALPVEVGDKHVPVSAPAGFRFEDVVKFVLRPVRLLQAVALDVLLAVRHIQTVFQRQLPADTGAAYPLVSVRNGPAIVVYAVEGDMHVRMLLVEVPSNEELSVPYAHPFHIWIFSTN